MQRAILAYEEYIQYWTIVSSFIVAKSEIFATSKKKKYYFIEKNLNLKLKHTKILRWYILKAYRIIRTLKDKFKNMNTCWKCPRWISCMRTNGDVVIELLYMNQEVNYGRGLGEGGGGDARTPPLSTAVSW